MFKNEKGFTLIEMLIVLLIITILIILIVPNLSGKSEQVHKKGCSALASVVQAQVDLYHLEKGSYPANLQTLVTEGFINESQTKCHGDKDLIYDEESGAIKEPNE